MSIIESQCYDFIKCNPQFILSKEMDSFVLAGIYSFRTIFDGENFSDTFNIKIIISNDYPQKVPRVKEIDRKISRNFHTNPDDSLCLGAPLEIKKRFMKSPTLINFMLEIIFPFLFSYTYYEKYNKMPFGELPHGGEGILYYYSEEFKIFDPFVVVALLNLIVKNKYRGHLICPCHSGNKLRNCHGRQLLNILQIGDMELVKKDLDSIGEFLKANMA